MHEMSICMAMVELVDRRAAELDAERVVGIEVAVGALGHVEPAALSFCFLSVARGSRAEGATLRIDVRPGRAFCFDCGGSVALATRLDPCPICGGHALRLDAGEELRVTAMEIA